MADKFKEVPASYRTRSLINSSMKCPQCDSARVVVIDSRPRDNKNKIQRRRACLECTWNFTTYEVSRESFKALAHQKAEIKNLRSLLENLAVSAANLAEKLK